MLNLSISLLGAFEATLDNVSLTPFRTKSVQALLIYLLCESRQPHQRETLMELLWPGMPPVSAQANLRQTLYRLRNVIPEVKGKNGEPVPFLLTNRQTIQINPDADYFVDVDAFLQSEPAQAIPLYRGDFLVDFYLPDSDAFENWVASRRADFQRRVLEMLEAETSAHMEQTNYDQATQLARQQLEIDNLRESSHRQLLETLARSGHRREALAHYESLCQLLAGELALKPEPKTVALIEAIRAGEIAGKDASPPKVSQARLTPNILDAPLHNLPVQLTSFIGRDKELAEVKDALNTSRLVTLTGSGGVGKTRLSLQVARSLQETYPHGAWLVELAPQTDPELVPQTVMHALGLHEDVERPTLAILTDFLQKRNLLLVLDNCEHLIEASAQLANTLLRACPTLRILASSREALGVPGEVPYRMPSLSLPKEENVQNLDEFEHIEAVRLFVERAVNVKPAFALSPEVAPVIAHICQRLDGIPLAIELAAARVKVLTVEQIATRLDDRFRLLTGGSRTALPRQQTLRALIDWSYNLLTEAERILLRRLSVFAGGWTLEGAENVCAGGEFDSYEVLDLLTSLVDKSLVLAQDTPSGIRYHRLETIRQYAREKFQDTDEVATVRDRHLAYYLALAETAEAEFVGPEHAHWFARLNDEWENINAALTWSLANNPEAGLQMVSALLDYWYTQVHARDAIRWLSQLFAQTNATIPPTLRAKALNVLSFLNNFGFDYSGAHTQAEESLALYQELDDLNGLAFSFLNLGYAEFALNHISRGEEMYEKSIALYRQTGEQLGLARALQFFGMHLAILTDYHRGHPFTEESLEIFHKLGHLLGAWWSAKILRVTFFRHGDFTAGQKWLEAGERIERAAGFQKSEWDLSGLGQDAYWYRDFEQARDYLEASLAMSEKSGNLATIGWNQAFLGYVAIREGNLEEARTLLAKTQDIFYKMKKEDGVIFSLEGLAFLAVVQGCYHPAAVLYGWADAARQEIQNPRPTVEQADVDHQLDILRAHLDEAAFAKAWAEGQSLTVEQAIALALEATAS